MGYKICPYCGAALDPEEKCDCQKEASSGEAELKVKEPANITNPPNSIKRGEE